MQLIWIPVYPHPPIHQHTHTHMHTHTHTLMHTTPTHRNYLNYGHFIFSFQSLASAWLSLLALSLSPSWRYQE